MYSIQWVDIFILELFELMSLILLNNSIYIDKLPYSELIRSMGRESPLLLNWTDIDKHFRLILISQFGNSPRVITQYV